MSSIRKSSHDEISTSQQHHQQQQQQQQQDFVQTTTSFRFQVRVITHQSSRQKLKTTVSSKSSTVSSYSSISNQYSSLKSLKPDYDTCKHECKNQMQYLPCSSTKKTIMYSSDESLSRSNNQNALTPVILPIRVDEKANSRTFHLTENLRSNIKFDVTLKPSFCIRNDRLDASFQSNQSLDKHNLSVR